MIHGQVIVHLETVSWQQPQLIREQEPENTIHIRPQVSLDANMFSFETNFQGDLVKPIN